MNKKRTRLLTTAGLFLALVFLFPALKSQAGKSFSIDPNTSCVSQKCHQGIDKGEYVHSALEDGSCTDCHEQEEEGLHKFSMAAEGNELCLQCHEDITAGKNVHSAITDGSCTDCHNPHASDYPAHLVSNPNGELCLSCHDEDGFNGTSVHKPVSEGQCLACHNPHSSDNQSQLVESVPQLCFSCHAKKGKIKKNMTGSPIKELYSSEDLPLHPPFADGECLECHNPHSSGNPILLAAKGPVKIFTSYKESEYELCFKCHDEFKEVLKTEISTGETDFRNGNQNLHYLHVVKKGRSCRSCHNPHGTKNEKLIRNLIPFGKRSLRMRFKISDTGGTCAPPCHFRKKYDRENPVENKR